MTSTAGRDGLVEHVRIGVRRARTRVDRSFAGVPIMPLSRKRPAPPRKRWSVDSELAIAAANSPIR